jgi:hypothetical protein
MTDNVAPFNPRKTADAIDLLVMEENLKAVKRLAFAINMITCSSEIIEEGPADALWEISRAIGNHADALIEQWQEALQHARGQTA